MARGELGRLETAVMKEVWRRGRATVREVKDALPGDRRLAYTTILTTLRNLERKGFVEHEVDGRSHVFLPTVGEQEVARDSLREVLDRMFDGSRARLVNTLFAESDLTEKEFRELSRRLRELRGEESDE